MNKYTVKIRAKFREQTDKMAHVYLDDYIDWLETQVAENSNGRV